MSDPVQRLNAALEGRYAIERELGEGGMATVYLADDLKHQRKVALKVLKPELAAVVGAERFLAEITTTANLTHPHILPLFDSGEADGFLFYVMPHIEGESLRERIDREKQLGVDDSVAITQKVAGALDYAHGHGVVHRDIKPGNILLSAQGEPLIADFGIALAVAQAGAGRITETGLSLGTPHYMSPEQATGDRDVDPRSDVYALGCVLYEMLAGQPPFSATTAQAVLVKILTVDAPSITSERRTVPPNVGAALAKSLEKLPADRFTSAAEFATALADPSFTYEARARTSVAAATPEPVATQAPSTMPGPWNRVTIALTGVAVVLATALVWVLALSDPPMPVTRVSVDFSEDQEVVGRGTFDISRDGSLLVYQGPSAAASSQLWVRPWASLAATPIRDTEGASPLAISPDGQEVAFITGTSIRVVPIQGGIPRTVAPDSVRCCVRWSPDGAWLYFNTAAQGLSRVPATGGSIEVMTRVDTLAGETQHLWIDVLPGGRAAVYEASRGGGDYRVFALSIESGEVTELTSGRFPRYSQGYLLVTDLEGTTLLAQPFDPESLELSGAATPIAEGLRSPTQSWNYYSVSQTGSLYYSTGTGSTGGLRLVVVDLETGDKDFLALAPRFINEVNWSPNGQSVAYSGGVERDSEANIYTYDVELGTERQLTFEGINRFPVFSPDGNRVAFMSIREGTDGYDLFVKTLDDDEPARSIISLPIHQVPVQWLSDTLIVFEQGTSSEAPADLWMLDLSDPNSPTAEVYLEDRDVNLRDIVVSPDGDLAAYTSDETGSNDVYIRSFPVFGERTPVSQGGGEFPFWSPDGDTVYYWTLSGTGGGGRDAFVAARIGRNPTAVLSTDTLFTGDYFRPASHLHPEGDRLIVAQQADLSATTEGTAEEPVRFIVVTNWAEELRRRAGN